MGVTIVSKGFNDEVSCSKCGSKLKFELTDVEFKQTTPMDMDDEGEEYIIKCPSCSNPVNVNTNVTGASRTRVKELQTSRDRNEPSL